MGTLNILGKIPFAFLNGVLRHVSLYERCCFGAVCHEACRAVVAVSVGIPVTYETVEARPDSLVTPILCRFLTVLLRFHLPHACPHGTVLHHFRDGVHSFACRSCGGALRFGRKAWEPVIPIAFSTGLADETALRQVCLQYIQGPAQPSMLANLDMRDMKSGYTCDILLKPGREPSGAEQGKLEQDRSPEQPGPEPRGWCPQCTCDLCRRSDGYGNISEDETWEPGVARTGRRKSRRGTKPSRLTQSQETCPYA